MPAVKTLAIPVVEFGRVQGRMMRHWDPFERNPHVAVYGITGSGKSHLIRYGILPLRRYSRTVVIDAKDDRDSVWSGYGRAVSELPEEFFKSGDKEHPASWRLVVDRRNAQTQLRKAFEQIRDEGHCVVVIDESRSITDREQAGLGSVVENIILEGRGLGITVIMGAQSTAWAVSALKDQPACTFIGQTSGQKQALTLAELVDHGRDLSPVISQIPARQWLYRDKWDGAILALTNPPGK